MNKLKILNAIEKYTLLAAVGLYPLIVLTSFTNIFETPKLLVLLLAVLIILSIKIVKSVIKKSFEINLGKFDIFVATLSVIFLVSALTVSPNKVDSFFLPGTASFVILSCIFYFLVNQFKEKGLVLNTLLVSVFISSIIQVVSFFGITKIIPFLPEVIKVTFFTTSGNILSSIVLLAALLPFLIFRIIEKSDIAEKVLSILVTIVFVISMATSIYLILPGKSTSITMLNNKVGWSIAVDSLKDNPILGVGPSNFSYAFNKFRPIEFNSMKDWNVKYLQSSSLLLTMFTEVGVISFVLFIYLLFLLYKNISPMNPVYISLLIFTLGIFTLPISATSFFIFFTLLAIFSETKDVKFGYFLNKIPQTLLMVPLILVLITVIYFSSRAFYAEFLFSRSVAKLNSNDGLSAYNLINKSVSVNPYSDRYHLFSAAINLALAENIAAKTDITDDDRKNISQLIQQSIREGKAAVAVNTQKSTNWEALSGVYQTIVAFAEGAETFAVESINQSISLDPINPFLRIKLGSIYYSMNKYDLAIETYKLAVIAKPDFANAHYNLALAYKMDKQFDKAKEQLEETLKLVEPGSKDHELSMKELESINDNQKNLEIKSEENKTNNTESLTTPEVVTPELEPQIELPQE